MTTCSLPRALPRLLVWFPGLVALILTGCYTVNNHYYGAAATSPGTLAQTTGNAGNCRCAGDYGLAGHHNAYYPFENPCPDRRISNPYYGGYYTGNPWYYPWYYQGTRYYGGGIIRGSGTSDVGDNPAYVGGVPATDRRPGRSGGGQAPGVDQNDVHAPVDNPAQMGGKGVGVGGRDGNDVHTPTDDGPAGGGFERPRGNPNDTHAPTTGPVQAEGVGAKPRHAEDDVHAPTDGDPHEGEVERPRRTERDVRAPAAAVERPAGASSAPAANSSTAAPAATEPRRAESPGSVPVATRTIRDRSTAAPDRSEPRRSQRVERAEASKQRESDSPAAPTEEAVSPATASPQPATGAPATAAPATAAPATARPESD